MSTEISRHFACYKMTQDGTGRRYDYHLNLTKEEVDEFPLGLLHETDGTPYIWTYGANNGQPF